MPCFSTREIHWLLALKPPIKLGLRMIYWGFIYSNKRCLSVFIPINSSSSAMGKGVLRQSSFICSHCPARMGCSMEWISNTANRSSFSNAFSGVKAPLASTRNSISSDENSFRMLRNKSNSVSKSIAPIFSLIVVNPDCSFSLICCCIKDGLPIQIKPLIVMLSIPSVKREGNNSNGSFLRIDIKACSSPKTIEGNSCNCATNSSNPKLI